MSTQPRRITTTVAITGQTQSATLGLTIGRISHIILTSNQPGHSFDFSIVNEKSDVIFGPQNYTVPQNGIRPELLPIGVITVKIENPIPGSGTVTVVALLEEQ